MSSIAEQIKNERNDIKRHGAGIIPFWALKKIETMLPNHLERTAETGCGASTIFFSNISVSHTVFCIDDRSVGDLSSVRYYQTSALFKPQTLEEVFGATQETLPEYKHEKPYDLVLIDGPHGWPFPEMEYFFFYPHIKPGGLLLLDDVQIPTIGRMADILQEDAMWSLEKLVGTLAVFRRTDYPVFSRIGDGWWQQRFNQRRSTFNRKFYLDDNGKKKSFSDRIKEKDDQNIKDKKIKHKNSFFKKILLRN